MSEQSTGRTGHFEQMREWEDAGRPMPISAVEVDSGECAYDCDETADYLVKVENSAGNTAKFRVCESCDQENRIWAERHLPDADNSLPSGTPPELDHDVQPGIDRSGGENGD